MTDPSTASEQPERGTVMLVSGTLDHALLAFEIAVGMQAMGTQIDMWFTLHGINCLKRPRRRFSVSRWLPFGAPGGGEGRNQATDTGWQKLLQATSHDGATHLPLSQQNVFGLGPMVLSRIMKKKGMASLTELILSAEELGVRFKICQICVDTMACDTERDLIVGAAVAGVSSYALDVRNSHYNAVI